MIIIAPLNEITNSVLYFDKRKLSGVKTSKHNKYLTPSLQSIYLQTLK